MFWTCSRSWSIWSRNAACSGGTSRDITWSQASLVSGNHSIAFKVVDAAGNSGAMSTAWTLTVDSSVPSQTVSISSVTDNVARQSFQGRSAG